MEHPGVHYNGIKIEDVYLGIKDVIISSGRGDAPIRGFLSAFTLRVSVCGGAASFGRGPR